MSLDSELITRGSFEIMVDHEKRWIGSALRLYGYAGWESLRILRIFLRILRVYLQLQLFSFESLKSSTDCEWMIPALEDCGFLDVGYEWTVFETLWSEDNSPYTCLFLSYSFSFTICDLASAVDWEKWERGYKIIYSVMYLCGFSQIPCEDSGKQ